MAYKQRNEIPEKYTWKLEDMYATLEDWEKAFTELSAHASDCTKYKGKLNNDVTLLEMLKEQDEYSQQVEKLYCYAFMAYCEDRKDTDKQSRYGKVMGLLNNISALSSFIEPELSELSDEVISRLIVDKRFTEYDEKLKALLRGKAHVLSAEEEKILANSGSITQSFSEIFNRLDGGEISFGKITIDGKEEELTHGLYSMALSNSDQKVRREAFNAYYKGYIDKINTISGIYEGSVKSDWFYAQSKKFGSSMELALFSEDVDRKVYDKLIEGIHKSLAPLHEYMQFRKDIMGLSELNMYDLYCPIVEDTDKACSYEEATEIVKSGLAPLGKDYLEVVNKAFNERWIDVMETPTKYNGAYSINVYGVHPYMLLNYQKTTHDIFTIAHEMGHSMHSYYSSAAQSYAKNDYRIFVAEVASTTNEILLIKYLLSTEKDVNVRKYLLSYYLDTLRTTMYRQAMFAEFEVISHDMVEKGQPLSYEVLNDRYYELNKEYYGPAVTHNPEIKYEWSRVPHFYRAFYVYKYSTGIISAVNIAQKILSEGAPQVERYKKFLSMGCSQDPVSELKVAGVDLTTDEPYDVVAKSFTETLKELKALCK